MQIDNMAKTRLPLTPPTPVVKKVTNLTERSTIVTFNPQNQLLIILTESGWRLPESSKGAKAIFKADMPIKFHLHDPAQAIYGYENEKGCVATLHLLHFPDPPKEGLEDLFNEKVEKALWVDRDDIWRKLEFMGKPIPLLTQKIFDYLADYHHEWKWH
jgi:hypothetical protein